MSIKKEQPEETVNVSKSTLEDLMARIAELEEKQIEKVEVVEESTTYDDSLLNKKIQQDDYIPVMSLIPYPLNLTTKAGGQGTVKRFTKFGEVKRILYRDLVEIVDAHRNLIEGGYFYIMHPAFIRQNGLDDVYSTILTKEKIEKILTTGSDECVKLYETANPKQQEIIVDLLILKIKENSDSVNLNVIDRISRISGRDIAKIAQENKEIEETTE